MSGNNKTMKVLTYSHRNGEDIVPSCLIDDVASAFKQIDSTVSRYEISDIRARIIDDLLSKGWSDKLILARSSNISITSKKNDVGMCMQTGNVSRMYADMMKLQALYLRESIKAGILIVATTQCAKHYTSNAATFERLIRELEIFGQVITVPLVIIGFYF